MSFEAAPLLSLRVGGVLQTAEGSCSFLVAGGSRYEDKQRQDRQYANADNGNHVGDTVLTTDVIIQWLMKSDSGNINDKQH